MSGGENVTEWESARNESPQGVNPAGFTVSAIGSLERDIVGQVRRRAAGRHAAGVARHVRVGLHLRAIAVRLVQELYPAAPGPAGSRSRSGRRPRRASTSAASAACRRHRPGGPSPRASRTCRSARPGTSRPCATRSCPPSRRSGGRPYSNAGSYAAAGDHQDALITHPFHPLNGRNGSDLRPREREHESDRSLLRGPPARRGPCQHPGFLDVAAAHR